MKLKIRNSSSFWFIIIIFALLSTVIICLGFALNNKISPKPKVLLCGFEPFGTYKYNTSWDAVSAYRGETKADYIESIELPVSYKQAFAVLAKKISEMQPAIVIIFAMGRDSVMLHRVAINLDDASWLDNDGEYRNNKLIRKDGPVGFWSTLPILQIGDALNKHKISYDITNFSGNYLSNHIFYELMYLASKNKIIKMAGLVHLPRYDSGFSKEALVEAVKVVVDASISQVGKAKSFPPQSSSDNQ